MCVNIFCHDVHVVFSVGAWGNRVHVADAGTDAERNAETNAESALKVRTGRPKINHDPDLYFFRDKNYRVGTLLLIDLKPGTPRFRHSNYMEIFRDYD